MQPSPHDPSPDTELYELHFPRLVTMATSELRMSEDDAVTLVHGLLIATLFRVNATGDIGSWLDGALRHAARRLAEERT